MTDAAETSQNTDAETTTWQQAQRVANRRRLLEASRQAFGRSGYLGTTVDDILKLAKVGRTSFYKHFSDKLELVSALFEDFAPQLEDSYGAITAEPIVDRRSVSAWLRRLLDDYAENAGLMTLFAEVAAVETGFSRTVTAVQHRLMRHLGKRFPRFAAAAEAAEAASIERTEAALLLNLVSDMCSAISLRHAELDREAAIRFVADMFLRFVTMETAEEQCGVAGTTT